ncbi:MAG: type IX secretion system sortase PorU [Bacteroidales bacterium]|nr:type IX secretion system sortase PorU [Bacteroidales bacterium]
MNISFEIKMNKQGIGVRIFTVLLLLMIISSNLELRAENSLLSTNSWYKIRVEQSGIYKLTYDDIQSMGFDNVANVRFYGDGGRQKSFLNSKESLEEMKPIPVYFVTGSDNVFNSGDYLLVYLEGPVVWNYSKTGSKFTHKLHDYSNAVHYFITTSQGQPIEIQNKNIQLASPLNIVNEGNWYIFSEKNSFNPIHSGRTWYGDPITNSGITSNYDIENVVLTAPLKYDIKAIGRNSSTEIVSLFLNSELIEQKTVSTVNVHDNESRYAQQITFSGETELPGAGVSLKLNYTGSGISDAAYLDYITLNAKIKLKYSGSGEYYFRSTDALNDSISQFQVSDLPANAVIWDITSINNVQKLPISFTGNIAEFVDESKELLQYVAVLPDKDYPKPIIDDKLEDVGMIENQNLRGSSSFNFIIVAHEAFLEPAEELAQWHRDKDDMTVLVTTPSLIYNEFSSGTRDISAIRNFFKHVWEKTSQESNKLKYALLFGDGSCNNHMDLPENTNYIPTYQSAESLVPTSSYVSDDFYGLLEDKEGGVSGDMDIGIGRFPVVSDGAEESDAWNMVNKVKTYYDPETFKDWRLTIAFLADDAEKSWERSFMSDSDEMASQLLEAYPELNIEKLYLDAYKQVTTSSGSTYPDAQEAVNNVLSKGVLVFNYMGHGGTNGITSEKVLQKHNFENLTNAPYYPLIITASCQVGRFDHVKTEKGKIESYVSAAEAALLNNEGGAIALLTTTRLVYQNANFALNKNVYRYLFEKDATGCFSRLGDVIRKAKNSTSGSNKLNFTLLGDPALKISIPENIVMVDSINSMDANLYDTISAFEEVSVKGRVVDNNSNIIPTFNGELYIKVFDKPNEITTNSNDGQDPFTYDLQKNIIYKGKAGVTQGEFDLKFRVPKDISYSFGTGKMSIYARSEDNRASGSALNFVIGGTSPGGINDNDGPDIDLFINDSNFVEGGITGTNPVIYAKLSDESGINTTGVGIGHDITAYLLEKEDEVYVLNDYYESSLGDYTSGTVRYPLTGIEEGFYTLVFKVWDINNNSSERSISFEVKSEQNLILKSLTNYPNPVQSVTSFQYTHNSSETVHNLTLEIFDLSGRIVYRHQRSQYEQGFVSDPIVLHLKGSGRNTLRPGVYPYRVVVETDDGKKSIINQKMIIN